MEQVPVHLWQVILSWMEDWTTKAKIEAAIAGHPIMDEVGTNGLSFRGGTAIHSPGSSSQAGPLDITPKTCNDDYGFGYLGGRVQTYTNGPRPPSSRSPGIARYRGAIHMRQTVHRRLGTALLSDGLYIYWDGVRTNTAPIRATA